MGHKCNHKQAGFTIVETMIAISVFTVLALLTTLVVIQIGRSYQLAATKTQLLDASRQVHATFTQTVQYGADVSSSVGTASGFNVWCAGTTRFAWKVSDSSHYYTYTSAGGGSLYSDTVAGPNACSSAFAPNSAKRLLPPQSFVTEFVPQQVTGNPNLYSLSTRFGVGTPDMFSGNDVVNGSCLSGLVGVEFCAVVQYDSSALKRIN